MPNRAEDSRRAERLASRVREELSLALERTIKDPRLANVSLTGVTATKDLSIVYVSIVVLGDDERYTRATAARRVLTRNEGMLKKLLAPTLGLRRMPEFRFDVDRGREQAARIEGLLREVEGELRQSAQVSDAGASLPGEAAEESDEEPS